MRDRFLLDPGIVFLNHGSFGACPREVLEAQQTWQCEMERNPVDFLARRSAALLGEARRRLAAYVGAQAHDLVFVTNATTAVNVVARSAGLRAGDEVATTDHEYGACDATWEHACAAAGARLVRVEVPLPFRAEQLLDRLFAAVTRRTRLVTLSHITSTTALTFPVAEVCRRARERGVLTLIDGAHGPGQLPVDLTAIGADFYTGNCHKWMCAPKGAAFLHVRPEHQDRIESPVVSWGYRTEVSSRAGTAAFTGSTTLERRLQWHGTRDLSAFLAVPAAIDFLARSGWPERRAVCHDLAVETRGRIAALTGLAPVAEADDVPLMAATPLPPCDPEALRAALFERHRIEVPITTHAGRLLVRTAFHLYNTKADADALLAALAAELPPTERRRRVTR